MNTEIIYLDIQENIEYENIINKVIDECFKQESLSKMNFYVSVTLTDNKNIKDINKKHRNIDKETDVLSFPMFEKDEIDSNVQCIMYNAQFAHCLGDIVISIPKVEEQANSYEHSFTRELSYMIVHGFYHLMGYDHLNAKDKRTMREKEEFAMYNV